MHAESLPILRTAALRDADTARVQKDKPTGGTCSGSIACAKLTSHAPRLKKPLWINLVIVLSLRPLSPRHPSPRLARRNGGRFSPNLERSSAISVDGSGVSSILLLNLGET